MSTGTCAGLTSITCTCLSSRFTNDPFVHGETFIKNYNKKNVTRRNLILALTNKPTDDQMHEGINAQRNNPTNLSIKTVLIHCVCTQANSTLDWMRGLGS
jgi:hypothetical protein